MPGVAQVPVPVQCETGVKVEPEHEAAPHETLVLPCSHAPAPLQLPVLPQGAAGGQPPCGSAAPAATFAHEPVAQVWQLAHAEDAQHTPSTQKLPVRQSLVAMHVWPRRRLLPHRFVCGSQMSGARQSASTVHAALHAEMPLHMYGAHDSVVAGLQVPWPSQLRTCVSVDELDGHEAGAHAVPAA